MNCPCSCPSEATKKAGGLHSNLDFATIAFGIFGFAMSVRHTICAQLWRSWETENAMELLSTRVVSRKSR